MPEPEKNEESPEPEALDVRAIRQLVRLMKRYDLTAIDFIEGPTQIRLRRRGPEAAGCLSAYPTSARSYAPAAPLDGRCAHRGALAPVPSAPAAPSGHRDREPDGRDVLLVEARPRPLLVRQRRLRPSGPDSTVCIIEAMKVFTDIPAGFSGTITEDFGQERPVGRIRPAPVPRQSGLNLSKSLRTQDRVFGDIVDVSANPGGQPRRDRVADHPRVQGVGDRGRRRLLAGGSRRSLPGPRRSGDLHRQGGQLGQLPQHQRA